MFFLGKAIGICSELEIVSRVEVTNSVGEACVGNKAGGVPVGKGVGSLPVGKGSGGILAGLSVYGM